MNDPRPDVGSEISRWRREASEELRAAEVVADHDDLPARVAGFHAHLAAEKAIKSLLLRRAVPMPRMHDLLSLQRLLPVDDQARFDVDDLELLNPWTTEGRYPADIADLTGVELAGVLDAARRVVRASLDVDG